MTNSSTDEVVNKIYNIYIYIYKFLNLFQLSRIYDLKYPTLVLTVDTVDLLSVSEFSVMRMLLTVMS